MKEKIITIYNNHKEIINYLIVGVLTTIVSLVSYYLLVVTILNPNDAVQLQIANIVSWIFAVTFAYFTNRKYVFQSEEKNMSKEMVKFYLSRVGTLLIDMFLMFLLVTILNINDKISKIIVQFVVIIANYLLSKFLVFKKKITV